MSTADFSGADIRRALAAVGLGRGDVVFTHANVGFFGRLAGAATAAAIYTEFKMAMLDVIGPDGTWVVPAFTYSFCRNEPFDAARTPSAMGMLSEMMRHDPATRRSGDANFSVVALGRQAEELTRNAVAYSFGRDSFWDRFLKVHGSVCNFNFDAGSTFVHYVERCLQVPYRYDKAFTGVSVEEGGPVERTFYHYVYDLQRPQDGPEFTRLDGAAKEQGIARRADLGKGQIVSISARDTFALIERELRRDPRFLTVGA